MGCRSAAFAGAQLAHGGQGCEYSGEGRARGAG